MDTMALISLFLASALTLRLGVNAQTYSATYLPSNTPNHSENGQQGTNQCGTTASQSSMCQNAYLNSVDDFCLWAPPQPGSGSTIGETERYEVSWCLKDGYGTRLIPDGSIQGAHFVQTPDFVQITGVGDLTKLNIPKGDAGGELDPHGADGNGNPIGGLVFSSAFGKLEQIHEWTCFMSDSEFCFRACKPGPNAPGWCQHIYDEMGCMWNMPANYDAGTFEQCAGDSGLPMGVYGGSTFSQGDPATPSAHPIPKSSACQALTSVGNGVQVSVSPIAVSTSTVVVNGTTSAPVTSSIVSSSSSPAITTTSQAVVSTATFNPASSSPPKAISATLTAAAATGTSSSSAAILSVSSPGMGHLAFVAVGSIISAMLVL